MQKICSQDSQSFTVTHEDQEFYKKMGVPAPTLCPACRYQRRLVFRNERNLYRRKCDAAGDSIVSIFSSDKSVPIVYSQDYWWSDKWDAKEYGRPFDFSRPFFEQWGELFKDVPQLALNNSNSENSEFTNQSENNKNCYLLVASNGSENCLHAMWMQKCKDSVDCLYLSKSELCYEVMSGENCYHCTYSQNLENCSDCHFCINCIGCSDCIGCVNLRNKKYHIFNKQYSPEEYKQKLKELKLDSYSGLKKIKEKILKFKQQFPQKYYHGNKTENISGDYLYEVKNTNNSFNCRYCENIKYCQDAWKARNCYDLTETLENDFCYELEGSAFLNNGAFCMKVKETHDVHYCSHCFYSKNIFGCVGLRNSEYCILNKQYTKEEYENLVEQIIDHMKKTKEWGEHFPHNLSQFGYNETVAQEYFPLSKKEVLKKGWKWHDQEDNIPNIEKVIKADQLPETISEVTDDILNDAIICEQSKRPFNMQKAELAFYRKMNLPLPHLHPDVRHGKRMALRNPRKLWERTCDNSGCSTEFETTFSAGEPVKVYCEKCYLNTVE